EIGEHQIGERGSWNVGAVALPLIANGLRTIGEARERAAGTGCDRRSGWMYDEIRQHVRDGQCGAAAGGEADGIADDNIITARVGGLRADNGVLNRRGAGDG